MQDRFISLIIDIAGFSYSLMVFLFFNNIIVLIGPILYALYVGNNIKREQVDKVYGGSWSKWFLSFVKKN